MFGPLSYHPLYRSLAQRVPRGPPQCPLARQRNLGLSLIPNTRRSPASSSHFQNSRQGSAGADRFFQKKPFSQIHFSLMHTPRPPQSFSHRGESHTSPNHLSSQRHILLGPQTPWPLHPPSQLVEA